MFQDLVELLERHLAPAGTRVFGSRLLKDLVTGEEREVDIVIETTVGPHPVRVGVEVIDHGRKASSPWIESIAKKHEHLEIDKTIVVSRSGFHRPALAKAAACKIDAFTFAEATALDWKARIDAIPRVMIDAFLMPYVTGCRVDFSEAQSTRWFENREKELPAMELFSASNEPCGTLLSFIQRIVAAPSVVEALQQHAFVNTGTALEAEVPLNHGSYLRAADGRRFAVARITITALCSRSVVDSTMWRGRFGETAVVSSSAECLGFSVRTVFSEVEGGGSPRASIQLTKTKGS
jgi:hypothetical protein